MTLIEAVVALMQRQSISWPNRSEEFTKDEVTLIDIKDTTDR